MPLLRPILRKHSLPLTREINAYCIFPCCFGAPIPGHPHHPQPIQACPLQPMYQPGFVSNPFPEKLKKIKHDVSYQKKFTKKNCFDSENLHTFIMYVNMYL